MRTEDLPGVGAIDHLAFEPIWQLSENDLVFSAKKSTYTTVVERDGEIVAYQMSSSSGMYAHLARLAVHPATAAPAHWVCPGAESAPAFYWGLKPLGGHPEHAAQ
jgi:hypothetical protein